MKKIFKHILLFVTPVLAIITLLFFINIIVIDFKFAHQSSWVYQEPVKLHKYFFINKFKKILRSFYEDEKLTHIKKINFLVEEQNLRKLLSNTPKSTKEWVNGKINFLGNNTQKIKYRYHGDNPGNWLFEKKQFKIKTKKNELIKNTRRFDYLLYSGNRFSNYFLIKEMSLLARDAELVEINLNGKSKGLFIELNNIDESFLRRNSFMPVNIYKGENHSTEKIIGLNENLFNNPKFWTKTAIFNKKKEDDYSDLKQFLISLNSYNENRLSQINDYIDEDYFSKFEALLTLTQNAHHDWYHNIRLAIDPWSGKVYQILRDPFISDHVVKNSFLIDFASNDLSKIFNVKSNFIHNKYVSLYQHLKSNDIVKKLNDYFDKIKNDLQIIDQREPYMFPIYKKNYIQEFNEVLSQLNSNKSNILKILEENLDKSFWSINKNGLEIVVNQHTPLTDISIFYKENTPNWIAIDQNYNNEVDENEIKFFLKDGESSKINLPLILYSNRIKRTSNETYVDQEFKLHNIETKFQIISSNNSKPQKIESKNFFTKENYTLKYKKNNSAVKLNKDNIILTKENFSDQITLLSGEIIIDKTKVFNNPVIIKKNTVFNIYPDQHIIFKNKVLINGEVNNPVIFRKYTSDNYNTESKNDLKPWGAVALLGKKTKGSFLNNIILEGGSGGAYKQYILTSMLAIHNTENINVLNSNFSSNEIFDDTIRVVYSNKINFNNIEIRNANADAIDIDISNNISLKDVKIYDSGNDGVDFMESIAEVKNLNVNNSGDKGISVGEKSNITIKNSNIINSKIGVAAKDNSIVKIYNTKFDNNYFQLAGYAKNWRYNGGGYIDIYNSKFRSIKNRFSVLKDPDTKKNNVNLRLKQNSKINIFNSAIDGEVIRKGKNIFLN